MSNPVTGAEHCGAVFLMNGLGKIYSPVRGPTVQAVYF